MIVPLGMSDVVVLRPTVDAVPTVSSGRHRGRQAFARDGAAVMEQQTTENPQCTGAAAEDVNRDGSSRGDCAFGLPDPSGQLFLADIPKR